MNIVITGAGKGMGKALTHRFAAVNNNILICSRTESELKAVKEEVEKSDPGTMVHYFVTDLSTRQGVADFASWIEKKELDIDVIINNAGSFIPGSVYNEEEGALEKMIEVNLYSAYHLTRSLLPKMMENKKGHIFNMASIASFQAYENGGAYSISKAALMGFSKNLREEMKPYDIKVTTIYPGAVYTPSWEASGIPPERFMEVNDIAELIYTSASLSPQACVEDLIVRPIKGDLS